MSLAHRRSTLACLFAIGLAPAVTLAACSGPMSTFEGALLQGADTLACSALTLIPVAGALLAGACPTEEAWVAGAIAHAEQLVTDGGASSAATSNPGTSARTLALAVAPSQPLGLGAPLYRGQGAARHQAGRCPCGYPPAKVAAAQAWLDAQTDGGQ